MALCGHNDCDSAAFAVQVQLNSDTQHINWTSSTGTLVEVAYRLASTDHILETQLRLGRGFHRIRNTYVPLWLDSGCTGSQNLGDWRFTRI
jgi:hypothetical protein